MYYFTVRFDIPNEEKKQEFEQFLQRAKKFWLAQPEVREFHVYGDELIDWPERRIEIAVNDRDSLQHILDSAERLELRKEMLGFVKRSSWQLLELKEYGDLDETISIAEARTIT
jgi:hypothetical protein